METANTANTAKTPKRIYNFPAPTARQQAYASFIDAKSVEDILFAYWLYIEIRAGRL